LSLALRIDNLHVTALGTPRSVSEGDIEALVCTGEDACAQAS
jgi:hypothetical protein